jgi:hypothetical protein
MKVRLPLRSGTFGSSISDALSPIERKVRLVMISSMPRPPDARFVKVPTFDEFRQMAADDRLSQYEKIGLPDDYREGFEKQIAEDIFAKLPALGERERVVLDIGAGCSDLARLIRGHCEERGHTLLLVDSAEMLAHHPDGGNVRKYAAEFPNCPELLEEYAGRVDAIIVYGVLQSVFAESSVHRFLDSAMALLAHGGRMLIGDIPNLSKRGRFFASPRGQEFHRAFMGTDEDPPKVPSGVPVPGMIDDSVLLGLEARARAAGCDAYRMPQADDLPMANRREDLLICRP